MCKYKKNCIPLLSLFLVGIFAFQGLTAVPGQINYQGRLTDTTTGIPLPNGSYTMRFRLFNAATGGTLLWNNLVGGQNVSVADGIYNVQLGAVQPFNSSLFDGGEAWLEVEISNSNTATWETFFPRQRVTSVAYALKAEDSDTLDGIAVSGFASNVHLHDLADLSGMVNDGQIPNDITVNNSINSDTLDGRDSISFADTVHSHDGSAITTGTVADTRIVAAIARDSEIMPIVLGSDGPQSGLNADLLDGLSSSSFLSTGSDYGRSGVASNLYEGTQTLTARYLNDDRADNLHANTTLNLLTIENDGTGRAIHALSGGSIAVRGEAAAAGGAGVAGYDYASNGVGVFGQGAAKGVHGYCPSGWGGYFEGGLYASGNVGIGTTTPQAKLHVAGTAQFNVGGGSIAMTTPGGWPGMIAYSPNGHRRDVQFYNDFMSITTSNSASASSNTNGIRIYDTGNVSVKVLQITGGSDLSEAFDIRPVKKDILLSPGMVVSIDPDNPGDLVISSEPYDRKVAGIISGAGGVKTGMLMGQQGSEADGSNPVALTGRVYCRVDTENGIVEPGDLLTTSKTPGHAMKVMDYKKAQGAVIGKAMTSLDEGTGLVLVLVSLQ